MCGISGIVRLDGSQVEPAVLERFNNRLIHRGPDGSGLSFHKNGTIGLGHRRLSILDLSDQGSQPMHYADKRYTITYNGEIFNFIELRDELKKEGFTFTTQTDTEVILAAYQKWGSLCLEKFNGMWAFSIWDESEQSLFIARDRFGIKPLYYLEKNDLFAFSSESGAFDVFDGARNAANQSVIDALLNDPDLAHGLGLTPFENIKQLLPGHWLLIKADGSVQKKRWYTLQAAKGGLNQSFEEQCETFGSLFRDSTLLRMRSDVPMATALSGGLDSSSVYAMVRHLSETSTDALRSHADRNKAFVVTFPGQPTDEAEYAKQVVSHVKGEAVYIDGLNQTDDLASSVREAVLDLDMVTSNPLLSIRSVYREMQNQGYKVSLDGHGVDEMMFGYRKMLFDAFNTATARRDLKHATSISEVLCALYAPSKRNAARSQLNDQLANTFGLRAKLKQLIMPTHPNTLDSELSSQLEALSLQTMFSDPYQHIGYSNFLVSPLPAILRRFDGASMASSVEVRMPFMDYRLVEFVFSLPFASLVGDGFTKRILRKSMTNHLPNSILERTYKIGFQSPVVQWLDGPLKELINDSITSRSFKEIGLFDARDEIKRVERMTSKGWNNKDATEFWKRFSLYSILNRS